MAESWKKLKTSNVFSLFIVCLNWYKSALVRELLSNNSLFVRQLYEDKSCCLLVIWSSLQLTSKLWIITKEFTDRADLFLKQQDYHLYAINWSRQETTQISFPHV